MTFVGLYMYNSAKGDVQRGESQMRRVEAARAVVLPTHKSDVPVITTAKASASTSGYGRPRAVSSAARSAAAPPTPLPPPPLPHSSSPSSRHHHASHSPHLTIQTMPLAVPRSHDLRQALSPVDSYPSPPPSLDDSPPSESVRLPHMEHGHEYGQ